MDVPAATWETVSSGNEFSHMLILHNELKHWLIVKHIIKYIS